MADTSDSSLDNDEFMDELDRYLSTGRIKNITDPLQWWIENQGAYPRLWRMARDYLTIPGVYHTTSSIAQRHH
jgi:hypothetical protein